MANIHQPSSELFKQFDHLLVLDRGGYPVYSGNPIEGITYFKRLAERVDAGESECADLREYKSRTIFSRLLKPGM